MPLTAADRRPQPIQGVIPARRNEDVAPIQASSACHPLSDLTPVSSAGPGSCPRAPTPQILLQTSTLLSPPPANSEQSLTPRTTIRRQHDKCTHPGVAEAHEPSHIRVVREETMQCFQIFWINYQHLKIRIFHILIFLKMRQTNGLDTKPTYSQGLSHSCPQGEARCTSPPLRSASCKVLAWPLRGCACNHELIR